MDDAQLEVQLDQWGPEGLALVCGIANAGGGSLIINAAAGTRAKKMRKMKRTFEGIPQQVRQHLGLSCIAEPIMEGTDLCLEIRIPSVVSPVAFDGRYYFYGANGNGALAQAEIEQLLHPASDEPAPKTAQSVPNRKRSKELSRFEERSIAASQGVYLTSTDEYVLKVLGTNGRATAPRIAQVLGVSESTVRRSFRRLREHDMIKRIGSDKAGYWKVKVEM